MTATSYSNFKNNPEKYFEKVIQNCDTLIVTRKNDENIVVMSEDEYSNLMENLYIMSNNDYYNKLIQGKREVEEGKAEIHDLIEVE